MKKLTYLVLLVVNTLFIGNSAAQSFSVPSPSASQMTRYGGSSINESSGRVTTSIPLYNFQAGNLSLPISLNYVGNGVRVDQHSNWVGTNWQLNSGGVVTRVVNHIADESAPAGLYSTDIPFLQDPVNSNYTLSLLSSNSLIGTLPKDLRRDLFSFSFPGYSGSFYLDSAGEPKLLVVDSELEIELQVSPTNSSIKNIIKITTPSGLEYFFGGDNASESSSTLIETAINTTGNVNLVQLGLDPLPSGDPNTPNNYDIYPKAITAFYLYKIKHPFGDEILLDYYDDGDKEYQMFQGENLRKLRNEHYDAYSASCNPQLATSYKESIYKGKIFNRKKIKKIYSISTDYSVNFTSSNLLLDPIGSTPIQYDDRVLNSIEIYNSQLAENVKKIDLDYITTPHRIFLETVKAKNNSSSSEYCSVYKMEYDSPESLPARFSKAQDLLGYANNQTQNTSLLPSVVGQIAEFSGAFSALANRELDFNYVKKGSLTKIHYPSGGYTQFDYEAPTVNALSVLTQNLGVHSSLLGSELTNEFYFGNVPTGSLGTTAVNDRISLRVSINTTIAVVKKKNPVLTIKLTRLSDGVILLNDTVIPGIGASYVYKDYNNILFQTSGDYKLELSLVNGGHLAYITGNAKFDHIGYESINAHGIRLKRVSDYSDNNATPLIKRYYYTKAEKALLGGEDPESAVITHKPAIIDYWSSSVPCCSTLLGSSTYEYVSLNSNPFGYFNASSDNQASYKYVTTSLGGDLFEEGAIQKKFRVALNDDPIVEYIPDNTPIGVTPNNLFLGSFTNNVSVLNGVLLKQTSLKNNGGNTLAKLTESEYNYNITSIHETSGVILTRNTNTCLLSGAPSIAYYNNNSYDFDLISVESKSFIGNLPSPTETGTFITNSKVFEYGDLEGLPTKITTSSSSDDEQKILKNYYLTTIGANNINSIDTATNPLSTQEENAYNSLISQKRISSPIQTESYIKKGTASEELRATQRTTFKDFNGLVLPEHSKSSKMNLPIETRSTSHQYDSNGAILEMSSDNNVKSAVIYGYKDKKIVAKLVNKSYGSIDAALIASIQTKANLVTNVATMNDLEAALDLLQATYPETQINTYIYNRLGQLAKTKDARGYEMRYEYEDCYRLEYVKDSDGNIIQEHQYNIINNQ